MKKSGIWLDHQKAVLVSLEGEDCQVQEVQSGAEKHYRHSGGWKSSGSCVAQSIVKEQKADERRKHQYHTFYQNIMKMIEHGKVYIFGPGEAKKQLKKEMAMVKGSNFEIAAVEPCDKRGNHDIVKKVKSFYHFSSP
ncbi:MAG: hypothetical protein OEV66_00125 [Spirochaetia bacterium]|nr:hypothetical protein [Spirochaetia bacterium]